MQIIFQDPFASLDPRTPDRRQHRRGAAHPRPRHAGRAARQGRPDDGPRGARSRTTRGAIPTSSAAASASASASRARSCWSRTSSSATSRSPRSTSRSRRRCSTCSSRSSGSSGLTLPVHRPQPGRRRAHQRPGRGHVPGPGRGADRPRASSTATRATPTRWRSCRRSRCRPDARRKRIILTGDVPSPRRPAAWLHTSTRAAGCAPVSAGPRCRSTERAACCSTPRPGDGAEQLVACHFRERSHGMSIERPATRQSPPERDRRVSVRRARPRRRCARWRTARAAERRCRPRRRTSRGAPTADGCGLGASSPSVSTTSSTPASVRRARATASSTRRVADLLGRSGRRPGARRRRAAAAAPRSRSSRGCPSCSRSQQRVRKRQPDGGFGRDWHVATQHDARLARRRGSGSGTADRSATVYGCRGPSYSRSTRPISTSLPRYITPTRSQMYWTTDRLWAMNR